VKLPATEQKLRGGYYTPAPIADFLCDWALRRPTDRVLEPSCGDGAVLESAVRHLLARGTKPAALGSQVRGIELLEEEAEKARARVSTVAGTNLRKAVVIDDFFSYCVKRGAVERFDAVVGNPPFIRFQHFPEPYRNAAFELMRLEGLKANGLTNAWVPFIVAATTILRPGGRLAVVLPAELMQVDYAAQLRLYLTNTYRRITVFTFRKLVFDGIQQEVVLLCAERGAEAAPRIELVELDGMADLAEFEHVDFEQHAQKVLDHSTAKWTQYLLTQTEIDALREIRQLPGVVSLGQLASVDVGVVTGINEFFVLTDEKRNALGLNGHARRLVARSAQLRGLAFSDVAWAEEAATGQPVHLLDLPPVEEGRLSPAALRYIRSGEDAGFHSGYKCRIRKFWYVVPSVWVPDAFMLRQIHRFPKLVLNGAGATCTDTIHRVRLLDDTIGSQLVGGALNSLTFAFSEVVGRSYGGGVLELEPREAEHLPIPYDAAAELDFGRLDALVRSDRIVEALDYADDVTLRKGLGLRQRDVTLFRGIWEKLQQRRIGRKSRAKKRPSSVSGHADGKQ